MIQSVSGAFGPSGEPHFDAVVVLEGKDEKAINYGYGWWLSDVGEEMPEPLIDKLNQITELMR